MRRSIVSLCALAAGCCSLAAQPQKITIAAAQIGTESRLSANLTKILAYTRRAAESSARVVVFPEGALCGETQTGGPTFESSLAEVSAAAKASNIYVVLGGASPDPADNKVKNWMVVFGPDGRKIFGYDKIYDRRGAKLPDVFQIDGIRCNAMICADRWLRGVEELPIMNGAQISFENLITSRWNGWTRSAGIGMFRAHCATEFT